MLNIYEENKIILLRKGLSMRKLTNKLLEAGYKVPVDGGLSDAFNKKRVKFQTVLEILDYLGYEITIREKQK